MLQVYNGTNSDPSSTNFSFFTDEFVENQSYLQRVTLGGCVRFDIDGHMPCSAEFRTFELSTAHELIFKLLHPCKRGF